MRNVRRLLWALFFPVSHLACGAPPLRAAEPLVEVAGVAPGVRIELRYATERNITGRALYPPGAACLLRRSVAERLGVAQKILLSRGASLKIWDAFRPAAVQKALWAFSQNRHFLADPDRRALHTWGVAVDATLTDGQGRELAMPTDFDSFTPAAGMHFRGNTGVVAANLRLLQGAMGAAGFLGMRTEWWHFIAADWRDYAPVPPAEAEKISPQPQVPPCQP